MDKRDSVVKRYMLVEFLLVLLIIGCATSCIQKVASKTTEYEKTTKPSLH